MSQPKSVIHKKKEIFNWRGKRVTQKEYKRRLKQVALANKLKDNSGQFTSPNLTAEGNSTNNDNNNNSFDNVEGRRIVHMYTLGKNMFCMDCNSILSLLDVVSEKRFGLASVLYVSCRQCEKVTGVLTEKQHQLANLKHHFDSNTKAVMGAMNSGMGNTHLNKILTAMNIPRIHWHTYQTHENEVIEGVQDLARASCLAAAQEERQLTIENVEKLKIMLSPNYQTDFLFPTSSEIDIEKRNISDNEIVRIAASFDMGWSTRGTGRSYDSLSGTAALIGYFSKKVIAYVTLNRKCSKCDNDRSPEDHKCNVNYVGSAKGMEPHAAVLLTKDHPILSACNLELGIFIADNDSSSICAVRGANDHEILKQSDKNHTSKGVVNELYKISKSYKELTSTSIQYLKKCFNYCVAQNCGDAIGMAEGIKNIPYHAFNHHNDCGKWCSYKSNPENYKHANIGEGFRDENLFEALKSIFDNLALRSDQFISGASSNPNESLNSMIISKAPKSRFYGKTPSGDGRVACAISKKNEGEKYVARLSQNLKMSAGDHTVKFCNKVDEFSEKRYAKSVTPAAKLQRISLKQSKIALKTKNQAKEGPSYESDIGLFKSLHECIPIATIDDHEKPITVLFDLETGGFSKTCDILQIAAKYKEYEFSVYIKPTQAISEEASKVHGLRLIYNKLVLHGESVTTVTLSEALVALYEFLYLFKRKCILTAHNCSFDYPRLMGAIEKCFLKEHFRAIILGYCDSLPIIKKVTGKSRKGDNKLENISKELSINCDKAHDALHDVVMLDQVLEKLNITSDDLFRSFLSWDEACNKIKFLQSLPIAMKELDSLKDCVSTSIRKKMVAANVTYEMIVDAYEKNKYNGLLNILGKDENGVVQVTKDKKTLLRLFDFFEKKKNNNQKCMIMRVFMHEKIYYMYRY